MKTIAFLGDSITMGYALADKSKRYATLVAADLGLEEENYGICGTLVAKAGLNSEDGLDFVTRLPLIESADVAVVFGGTNDYFWSDKPIAGEDDTAFAHAVETIGKWVCEKRKGKITLFVTPYPHNGIGNYEGGAFWKDSNQHDTSDVNFNGQVLSDYVAEIEAACQKLGLPCLNLHKNFDFDWQKHTSDGCHP
ncbi:MAG: SGNH/GDSL hydrolase family protein, partial [Clostridia bacterium]|nr:SGNH/GDSL hydrolase family protein [Clostridia bacterium]